MPHRAYVDESAPTANPHAWAISVLASILAAGNIALGWVLATGPGRLRGASFQFITNGSTAGAHWWGAAFVTFGAVALFAQATHRKWPARVAHFASAFGCLYWVAAFGLAGSTSPAVPYTGCVAYAVISVAHAISAIASPHR